MFLEYNYFFTIPLSYASVNFVFSKVLSGKQSFVKNQTKFDPFPVLPDMVTTVRRAPPPQSKPSQT